MNMVKHNKNEELKFKAQTTYHRNKKNPKSKLYLPTHLSPLTTHHSPLTSHLSPLTYRHSPLIKTGSNSSSVNSSLYKYPSRSNAFTSSKDLMLLSIAKRDILPRAFFA